MTRTESRWTHEAQQARSRETQERIADAAASLLEERGLEALTVKEIAARADASVGGFYRRFRDKEALLHHLDERLAARAREILDETPLPDPSMPLNRAVAELCTPWVRSYLLDRGVRRALHVRARRDPEFRRRAARTEQAVARRVRAFLDSREEFSRLGEEELALLAGTILTVAMGFLREVVLFREQQVVPVPDTEAAIRRGLVDAICGLLRGRADRTVPR